METTASFISNDRHFPQTRLCLPLLVVGMRMEEH